MRIGLTVSILAGGLITAAILIAGTSVQAFSSFPELAGSLREKLGVVGVLALGVGLFAAGFSSTITAPYASSIIASVVFGWEDTRRLRWVWGTVLLIGFLFGVSGIRPIPVILTVQALNGMVLPLLVALLIVVVNQRSVMAAPHLPGLLYNLLLLLMLGSVVLIGLNQVEKALISLNVLSQSYFNVLIWCSGVLMMVMAGWMYSVRM